MVAFNIWARDELMEPPVSAAGLERFTVVLPKQKTSWPSRGVSTRRMYHACKGKGRWLSDPEGNRLRMVVVGNEY